MPESASSSRRTIPVPLALLCLCLLAYGLLLPGLGFYWDDWPWVWLAHQGGPAGMLYIDHAQRPLAGEILWVGSLLAGSSPWRWQALNLVYRWLTGVALWWTLRRIWPKHPGAVAWMAALFLVYPGFRQQFVSVNSSRHILPLAAYLLSLGCMLSAARQPRQPRRRSWLLTLLALGLDLGALLATDYFYGLELLRPIFLWLALEAENTRERLKAAALRWLPYFGMLLIAAIWRYELSRRLSYAVTLSSDLLRAPLESGSGLLQSLLSNCAAATVSAWANVFDFPRRMNFGLKIVVIYWILVAATSLLAWLYMRRFQDTVPQAAFLKGAGTAGILALLVGSLPFLATGLPVALSFPADRATLPMMLGASLLLVGLVQILGKRQALRNALLALAVGLAVGMHFLTALSFQQDWEKQQAFFRQLAWRAPALKPGTALFYAQNQALQNFRSTDNSLTAPLNWIYAPENTSDILFYDLFDLRLRLHSVLPALQDGRPITDRYGRYEFRGSSEAVLLFHYAPPACLHIFDPKYDTDNPQAPDVLASLLPLSNLGLIKPAGEPQAILPSDVFGVAPEADWCYYFEKADLARQFGDWQTIVDLGQTAAELGYSPRHPAERVPFIQGFAYTGQWWQAEDLTYQAFQSNGKLAAMLCAVWTDLDASAPSAQDKPVTVQRVKQRLGCPAQ
ncbi:MAG: hypothetical protein AB1894_25760 [Chloroflexota bacterium]